MREILFRAKREATNEWVYGYFVKEYYDFLIYVQPQIITQSGREYVNENTLGQFTGLTDKNGVKIFEGDIITFEDVCCEGGSGYEYPDEWAVETMNRVEVVIRNGCVCFGKELFETSAYEDIQSYYPNLNEWFAECAEVIGNIYDNPELIVSVEKNEEE